MEYKQIITSFAKKQARKINGIIKAGTLGNRTRLGQLSHREAVRLAGGLAGSTSSGFMVPSHLCHSEGDVALCRGGHCLILV